MSVVSVMCVVRTGSICTTRITLTLSILFLSGPYLGAFGTVLAHLYFGTGTEQSLPEVGVGRALPEVGEGLSL